MKTIYKASLLVGLIAFTSVASGQTTAKKDSTLNRQVNLEREYTPVIKDASKINTIPSRHETNPVQHAIKFENAAPAISIMSYEIADTGSGDISTDIAFNKKRGYLVFGAGNYMNLEGALGYRIVDSESDQLDFFGTHNSTNGNIKYLESSNDLDKVKAKNMENFVKTRFSHKFDNLIWHLSSSFLNNSFNYYGNPYLIRYIGGVPSPKNLEKNQTVNIVEVETGVASKAYENTEYAVNLKYNNYSTKYGPDINIDGLKANIFYADANFAAGWEGNKKMGLKGSILHQNISSIKCPYNGEEKAFQNLTVINVNPYFKLDGGDAELLIGAKLNYAIDQENKLVLAPTIKASWMFAENSSLYLTVDGGINDNTLIDIFKENRYITTSSRVAFSRTLYDAQIGVKSGVVNGLEFDIFGGYKYTKDEHFYLTSTDISWTNVSSPVYANTGTGNFGGLLKTKLIPYTDFSVKAATYFYNVSKYTNTENVPQDKKAWGLPTFTFDVNADFSFIDNFILSAGYIFEGGRKTYINGGDISMKNINELNLKASYNLLDWITIYARVNNVLNQKYERYYGYTLQGVNALGGISLTF